MSAFEDGTHELVSPTSATTKLEAAVADSGSSQQFHDENDDDDDDGNITEQSDSLNIDDAIEKIGMGKFQLLILVAAGLCFAADAMEVLLLSFLTIVLQVEWNLTETQTDSIVSVVFLGAMLGTLILGPLGDSIGRRPVFNATAAIITTFGIGTAFATSFEVLLFTRFMVGFGVGGLTVPFDCLVEFLPTSHRGRDLLYIEFFWTGGTLLVPLAAYLTLGQGSGGSWRTFVIICSIPCFISALLGILLVPESPRWLITQDRHDEALKILREAASRNGKDPFTVFPDGTKLEVQHHEEQAHSQKFLDLCSIQWRRITSLLWVTWSGLAFLYYGIILLISLVFSAEGDDGTTGQPDTYNFDYSAILISGSSEIPGVLIVLLTVDSWGRIPSQILSYTAGGLCALILGLLSVYEADRNLLVLFSFLARMFMMGASCMTWVSTSEVLPTEIRATGHSAANAVSRLSGALLPFIINEKVSTQTIGIVMLCVSIVTSLTVSRLPETAGKALGEVGQVAQKVSPVPTHEMD